MLRAMLTTAVAACAVVMVAAGPALAGPPDPGASVAPPTDCGNDLVCIGASSPGHHGSGGHAPGGGGHHPCVTPKGTVVPCTDPNWGTFSGGCYYRVAMNVPPDGDPAWQGHSDADTSGTMYWVTCPDDGYVMNDVWLPNGTVGTAATPAQLAQRALAKMRLAPPAVHIDPKPGGLGLVGLPVWMWVGQTVGSWGPQSASASAGGITVTATAKVTQVVWSMGDGAKVTCSTAGTPYTAVYGKKSSPDCGYRFARPSTTQPGGTYTVTATATWTVRWAGGGQRGQLTETRTAAAQLTVAELQVVN